MLFIPLYTPKQTGAHFFILKSSSGVVTLPFPNPKSALERGFLINFLPAWVLEKHHWNLSYQATMPPPEAYEFLINFKYPP